MAYGPSLSTRAIVCPLEVQGLSPARSWGPSRGQRGTAQPSQSRIPVLPSYSGGRQVVQKTEYSCGARRNRGVLGARGATWKGLYGLVLTASVARAQYKDVGPQPGHLALGTLGPRGLPNSALMRRGQELHWPRSLCGACAERQSKAEGGAPRSPWAGLSVLLPKPQPQPLKAAGDPGGAEPPSPGELLTLNLVPGHALRRGLGPRNVGQR